jgi:hypothetical protein
LGGGWIFPSYLPQRLRLVFEKMLPYSALVFLALVISHVTDYLMAIPLLVGWAGLGLISKALGFD